MNREEFLQILKNRLSFLNDNEINIHLDFYEEAINDRIDDGMNEFDAVKNLGPITDIVKLIKDEYSDEAKELETKEIKEEIKIKEDNQKSNNENKTIFLIVAICSFPIWFSIIVTILALVFSFFIMSFSFIFGGVALLFSTFTILSSPLATILLNIGLSLLLISIGLILVLVCKYSCVLIRYGFNELKKFLKGENLI